MSSKDPEDPDVVAMIAFQNGDNAAFEQLLDKFNRSIVNFIYKIVNNRAEAEELAQEVFLKVYQAKGTYEPRARFSSWLYRIATNVSLKAMRKRRHFPPWFGVNSASGEPVSLEESVPDRNVDAEGRLVQEERGRFVRQAVRSLPEREKIAIILRRYEGLTYKEIAEIMNCTEAAVKTFIHRGKIRLRDRMLSYLRSGKV